MVEDSAASAGAAPKRESATREAIDRVPVRKQMPARNDSGSSHESPHRHHYRKPTPRRHVKETLNAHSEYRTSQDDGAAEHKINQYIIKQEIGRGSFGAVHLAVDQFGTEYAVKEFSKSRLRKRAQSHLLRRRTRRPGGGFNSPLHRHPSGSEGDEALNPLYLIKEEIAIMKKLNHDNIVSLIEVLDDPAEDSLYMVMEMCKKGVIMKVSLEERADPYDDEHCRCWFRDLILGIEYLHAQGIVHRDIKPDNCLLTGDDVLKVVDFGVSEMFEKDSNMYTAKSAGSPAFIPPELCVAKHGDVSGKAADIWSMGVTLYCLRYGRLPFEKESIFELYQAIRNDPVECEEETDERFKDLMARILEKDPARRITMRELREHPWVTQDGRDPLLSEEENIADIVGPPTEEEMNSAITSNMGHVFAVVKAVNHFKKLLSPPGGESPMRSILGQDFEAHFVQPPLEMEPEDDGLSSGKVLIPHTAGNVDIDDKDATQHEPVSKGHGSPSGREETVQAEQSRDRPEISSVQNRGRTGGGLSPGRAKNPRRDSGSIRSASLRDEARQSLSPRPDSSRASSATKRSAEGTRGQARDPLEEDHPYLFIGPSTYTGHEDDGNRSTDPIILAEESSEPSAATSTTHPADTADDEEVSVPIVSESPGAAEFDIYETAYKEEIERIRSRSIPDFGTEPVVYLTHRAEGTHDVMKLLHEKVAKAEAAIASLLSTEQLGDIPHPLGMKKAIPALSTVMGLLSSHIERGRTEQKERTIVKESGSASQKSNTTQQQPESQPQPHPGQSEPSPPQDHHRSRSSVSSASTVEPTTVAVDARGETASSDLPAGSATPTTRLRNLLWTAGGGNGSGREARSRR